ncbi:MAG: nitroreductase family protein [Burkholderiales bacterium]|nr:nitroreductase family protein [Burkholderiales bacterium]
MQERKAITSVPINELAGRRWSTRAFDASRGVTPAQVAALIEAARWAPSCFGAEPWRFLMWDRARDPAGWQQAYDCLSDNNRKWCKNVPLLFLACAGSIFEHNGQSNRWAQYDTGMAALALTLEAVAQGLVAHQMGGFDIPKVRAAFAVPEDYMPMAMIAVGHQAGPEVLDEETLKKELKARERKPVAERFFGGRWNTPAG